MNNTVKRLSNSFLDILFPPLCLGCRAYLTCAEEKVNLLCADCFSGIEIYKTVFYKNPHFSLGAVSSYSDNALKNLIHYFKYEGFISVKEPLDTVLSTYMEAVGLKKMLGPSSVIVPLPLHRKRVHERGFNQSDVIAEIVSKYTGIPVDGSLLERTRYTRRQADIKGEEERRKNVMGCFKVPQSKKGTLRDVTVVLVDDVYTSGATMAEAVKTLRRAGTKDIIGLVIAKAD